MAEDRLLRIQSHVAGLLHGRYLHQAAGWPRLTVPAPMASAHMMCFPPSLPPLISIQCLFLDEPTR